MKGIAVFVICLATVHICKGMTEAQMNKAGKLMQNVCVPKSKVTLDQVKNIKKGEFLEDENVKCYIACVYQMANILKNGKLNYDAAIKQIDFMFPEERKPGAKQSLDECRYVPDKIKDICEASFQTAKCMYNSNPPNFVFP